MEPQLAVAMQQKMEINSNLVGKRIRFQQIKKNELKVSRAKSISKSIVSSEKALIMLRGESNEQMK